MALLALETELRTPGKHRERMRKISQQRRDLRKAEIVCGPEGGATKRRQLSEQEKSCRTHEKETLRVQTPAG